MTDGASGLVGDVGGTNARFAIAETDGEATRITHAAVLQASDYPSGEAALAAYLDMLEGQRPRLAVIAAAGPVIKGCVDFTNNGGWGFSEKRVCKACGFVEVKLINDFTAQALALDRLAPRDSRPIGRRVRGRAGATAAIMGPGTGFGSAALVRDGRRQAVMTGEGGHWSFAPEDEVEIEILRRLMVRFGEVSVERVLSGPGLLNLYQAMGAMTGQSTDLTAPADITREALAGEGLAREALSRFCAILGSIAGNFALAVGAEAGVYICGGIAPDIFDFLEASDFRRRFETKDRMSDYLAAIPTRVVTQPHAALIGAAALLGELT
ncbi:MAG TPA: glucokinase [Caulobacteraceae bacterium]|nr:glucokinase [Caulobacteraceae bacterium]